VSENALNQINNIPVRTWRWLGVNSISIEKSIPMKKTYKDKGDYKSDNSINIVPMDSEKNSLSILNSFDYEGISGK